MRKLSILFTLVIASAMILSSCAPATPVATDAPGDVPVVAPTEAPAMPTEAPMRWSNQPLLWLMYAGWQWCPI